MEKLERPEIITSSLNSIEKVLRTYANNYQFYPYFTDEERNKLGELADQITQIRIPISIKTQE